MLPNILTLKFLNIVRPLTICLIFLGFSVLTASHTMEENSTTNSPENLNRAMALGEEKPFLPLEVLFKILPYVDDITLIQADIVCWDFKLEGDRIWKTKLLDLSRRLETPSQNGFDRAKTFTALEGGRYKNVRLQYCGLGDMDEFSSLMNCKIIDLSHNYIHNAGYFYSHGTFIYLQELNLSHNKLSQETLNKFKETYKHLEILILEPQRKIERRYGYNGGHYGVRGTREYNP